MPRFQPLTAQEMDGKQKEAEADLGSLPTENTRAVADWWKRWYMSAGHKRLGRTLLKQTLSRKIQSQSVAGQNDVQLPPQVRAHATISNAKCTFTENNLDTQAMFSFEGTPSSTRIVLNTSHAAYPFLSCVLDQPNTPDPSGSGPHQREPIDGLKLLLRSWAIYEDQLPPDGPLRSTVQGAREDWGLIARRVARQQITDR
jgi:hypothetical protein